MRRFCTMDLQKGEMVSAEESRGRTGGRAVQPPGPVQKRLESYTSLIAQQKGAEVLC
jgi:hypothetical protein